MAKDIMQHAQDCDVHTGMNFGAALEAMRNGMAVRLPHWSPEVKILIQKPDDRSKMTAPYLYVQSRFGRVPWNPTQVELLSADWQVSTHIDQ